MAESFDNDRSFILDNLRARVEESTQEPPKLILEDLNTRIDRDFTEIRQKFNAEIQKVEEEMARFRSELMDKDGNLLLSALTPKAEKKILDSKEEANQHGISSLNTPSILKQGKRNVMKLRFDVSQFEPEEVVVSAVDDKLSVQAKHEQKSDGKSIYMESSKEVRLPKGVKPNTIRSSVTKDGVLTVDAPLPDPLMPQKLYISGYR